MSSISSIGNAAAAVFTHSGSSCSSCTGQAAADGDTAAQEAAETNASKQAEKQNGGFAPKTGVDKIA